MNSERKGIRALRLHASYASGMNYLNPDYHIHDIYEIFIMTSAQKALYYIEDTEYELSFGDVLVINNKERHKLPNMQNMDFRRGTISFRPSLVRLLSTVQTDMLSCFENRKVGCNNLIHFEKAEFAKLVSLFENMIHTYKNPNPGSDILSVTYFFQLLVLLNNKYNDKYVISKSTRSTETSRRKVQPILDYIDLHLNEAITLDAIGKSLSLNKNYLSKIMKQETGLTIHKYIIKQRIDSAKALLTSGYNVTDACFLSGFQDYTSFIRCFKRETGCTPGDFKRTH